MTPHGSDHSPLPLEGVGPLTVRADNERYAVLPGVADKPPGRVQVGELDPGFASLAAQLLALHCRAATASASP